MPTHLAMTGGATNLIDGCSRGELTVAAGLARRLVDFAAAAGADRAVLMQQSGIAPATLEDQDARLPLARYQALMRAAKALTGDPALPLHYGGSVDMAEFSLVGMLFRTCETIAEALVEINRYGRLIIEVDCGEGDRFHFARRDDGLWLVDTRANPDTFPELTETTFARFVGMTRPLVETIVREVHVSHAEPAHADSYRDFFRVPVRFEAGWNAMRLDEEGLRQPIRQEPRYVFGIFSERAQALLDSLAAARSMRGRIEKLILPILHKGEVRIDRVAGALGQSRQTVYRRLKAEGITYEQLIDALRHRLALDYLRGRRLSVTETAYLVGFSDPAAFSRAFKRWTGTNPRDYARRAQTGGGAAPLGSGSLRRL